MPYDNMTAVTDDLDDNLAAYQNEKKTAIEHVMSASAYSAYTRTQSMTGNVTLTDSDLPIQSFSPTAARDLTLPTVATTNHAFFVFNRSGTYAITVKNASAVVIAVLQPYSHVTLESDGANLWSVSANSERETNYKISPTVATNNLTLTITHMDGTTPSASRPLWFRIGNTWRACVAALSVTKNAATNWCNAGSAALAAKEIDYFVYVIWNTTPATDVVDVGFSRIPSGKLYSDFSGTTTNEKYLAYGNASAPTSTDDVVNIGRAAATLSAGAGYTWSVPTYTTMNLVQSPTFETRSLLWTGAITSGSGTPTNPTSTTGTYIIQGNKIFLSVVIAIVTKGTAAGNLLVAGPFVPTAAYALSAVENLFTGVVCNANYQTTPRIAAVKYDATTLWVDGYNVVASGWALI